MGAISLATMTCEFLSSIGSIVLTSQGVMETEVDV
jgi:hypothetical protein